MNFKIPNDIDMTQQASWCPGCGHGIVCRVITEAVTELGVSDRIITVDDVACGQFGQFAQEAGEPARHYGFELIPEVEHVA